jgi:hypothetical protein
MTGPDHKARVHPTLRTTVAGLDIDIRRRKLLSRSPTQQSTKSMATPDSVRGLDIISDLQVETWSGISVPPSVVLNTNYNAGDGGGTFRFDAGDTTSPDDGALTIVDASGNRWKRLHNGCFHPGWFGAIADGTSDDTAAITAWLNAASAADVWADAQGGTLAVTGNITLPDNCRLKNARFKQLDPDDISRRTLTRTSGSGALILQNVVVDKNGDGFQGSIGDAAFISSSTTLR